MVALTHMYVIISKQLKRSDFIALGVWAPIVHVFIDMIFMPYRPCRTALFY